MIGAALRPGKRKRLATRAASGDYQAVLSGAEGLIEVRDVVVP